MLGSYNPDLVIDECTRSILCVDCGDERCIHHGKKESDCPKYWCDNPYGLDNCDECDFIDEFIKEMRKQY